MTLTPISNLNAVVLDQTYDPPKRGLYVGVSGDVSVVDVAGNTVVLKDLAAGVFHPVMFRKVNTVGTAATDIVAGE